MKIKNALDIIEGKVGRQGYLVSFEVVEGCIMRSDHFPDAHAGEPGFATEEEAWAMAAKFANAKYEKKIVNVFVVHAHSFAPVKGYREREMNKHRP